MSEPNCIFCKIASGAIPAMRVYEDERVMAFLDINPLAHGHTLVIPKVHYRDIRDVPADMAGELAARLPKITQAVMRAAGATGMNILQNTGESSGQAVFHLHIHLIPRRDGDGLGYRWNAGAYPAGAGEAMRQRVIEALRG